jgi:hypothetical protein
MNVSDKDRVNRLVLELLAEDPEIVDKVAQRVKKLAAEERPGFANTQPVKQERPGPRMGL